MRKYAILVATLAAALAVTGAIAQPRGVDAIFKVLDKNGDGVVTKDEWLAAGRHERAFDRIDENHDGKITPAELNRALVALARSGKRLPSGALQTPAGPQGPAADPPS